MATEGNDNPALQLEEKQLPPTPNNTDSTITIDDDLEKKSTPDQNYLFAVKKQIRDKIHENPIIRKFILTGIIHAAILAYVVAAFNHWKQQGSKPLDWTDGLGLLLIILSFIYATLMYYKVAKPCYRYMASTSKGKFDSSFTLMSSFGTKAFYTVPPILLTMFLIQDTVDDRRRLISLAGISVIVLLGLMFSKHPSRVDWEIVYRGIFIQVTMAMITVRWKVGRDVFVCIGNKIEKFLSYSYVGAAFVYSENLIYQQAIFAFKALSVIFFVNFIVEILFYYQILQKSFVKLGWLLQKILGTSVIESINCCVSVFLGFTEAMLVIKNYMKDLTKSELQAVLLGSLSTVAGSVFAAYVSFGVNPGYLVTASVMSAPAALSLSKLLYPETEVSKTKVESITIDDDSKDKHSSALSAGCEGAISAVSIVQSVVASLIAFISLFAFANGVLSWMGELIGYENLTFELILAKAFIPVAYLIGIDPDQCEAVAELIATKALLNEFVAYQKLGNFKKNNLLSRRSEAIATYALCSFSNPGSVASLLAMVSILCRPQLENATKLAFRAYVGGIVTCFMTASIAGLLMPSMDIIDHFDITNHTNITSL